MGIEQNITERKSRIKKNGIVQKKTIVLTKEIFRKESLINWVLENMNNPDSRTYDLDLQI